MTRVLCCGTFDGLHAGHLFFLAQAKKFGEELIVVVAADQSRKKFSGKKPWLTQKERCALVGALRTVDRAVPGSPTNFLMAIKKYRPQVVVLGHDQTAGVGELLEWMTKQKTPPRLVRLPPFKRQHLASSLLKKHCGRYNIAL